MSKWQYLVVKIDTSGQYEASGGWQSVNTLGEAGWELVAIDSCEDGAWGWFKRPKDDSDDPQLA